MTDFLTQLSVMMLAGLVPMLVLASGRALDSGTFRDWLRERKFALFAIHSIYVIAAVLMVNTELDVLSALSGGFGLPVIGGSVGFGAGVSALILRQREPKQ